MRFEWDSEKAEVNLAKHGVAFEEAVEVFLDPNALEEFDQLHSDQEPRFRRLGLSSRRLLLVVFVERIQETMRILSARKATAKEQALYEE